MGASTHPTLAYGANYFERWNNPNGQPPIGSGAGSGVHGNLNTKNYPQTAEPSNTQSVQHQTTSSQIENRDLITQNSVSREITDKQTQASVGWVLAPTRSVVSRILLFFNHLFFQAA